MKSLYKALLGVYLVVLIWLVLFKFSTNFSWVLAYQTRSLNLIPFANFSSNLRGMFYNVIIFIPFGLLLSVNLKRATFWQKLALVFLFSLDVELIQFIFAIGITDITDVITNTFGGFLGLLLYDASKKYVDDDKLDRAIAVAGAILLAFVLVFIAILLSGKIRFHVQPRRADQALTRYSAPNTLQHPHQVLALQIPAEAATW